MLYVLHILYVFSGTMYSFIVVRPCLIFSTTHTGKDYCSFEFIYLLKILYVYECFACMHACALLVYLVPKEARRHWIIWNWLWATNWVQGIKSGSSGRQTSAFNHWVLLLFIYIYVYEYVQVHVGWWHAFVYTCMEPEDNLGYPSGDIHLVFEIVSY